MEANKNPDLEVGFCTTGTKIDIPEQLQLLGVTPENPTIHGHVINKLFNMIFENLNHQKKKAISFWEPDEEYEATANNIDICRRNNKIYFCKQSHNDTGDTPKDPATNPTYWGLLYDLDNPPALGNHSHSNYLSNETGIASNTSPNALYKGVGLFMHADCPTNTENWYIIAINYTTSENASSMQIAVSSLSTVPKMYVRTKHYSKTTWESWTQLDNSNSAPLNHTHTGVYAPYSHSHDSIYSKKVKRLAYDGSAIEGQYGFSSVVRSAAGRYVCYFSTPMPDINYSVVTSVLGSDFVVGHAKATNYVAINRIHSSDNVYYDGGFSLAILED